MAQRNQLTWGELRVGLFVLAGVGLLILAIFYVTGFGDLTAKYRLVTYLPEVSGVTAGAPVQVDGIDVGNVDKLSINTSKDPHGLNPERNIELVMRIAAKYKDYIRADSKASLVTQGLLGDRFVNISRGFLGQPLQNNQEIPGTGENGINQLVAQGANLAGHVNILTDQINGMVADIRAGKGSLGKFVTNDAVYDNLQSVSAKLDVVLANVQAGQGSFGKLYVSDELYNKLNSSAGHFDNILDAVQQQKGTVGKLIYDPSLHDNANKFIAKGNSILDDTRAGKGTIGKLMTDDTLFTSWKQAGTNISTATAKLNTMDNTAGKFFNDPQFYDNLTGMLADARLLLNDFRQNPKKFLRVKFSIF
jgi:phospholipid/cholesterol/gamma-HCH transport system substrate-binding protein